jgi:hypothetical protein
LKICRFNFGRSVAKNAPGRAGLQESVERVTGPLEPTT